MGRADALEAMLRDGAVRADAVDASSEHGFSLLMVAAMSGAKGACKRLLSLGADASAADARGRTALDLALEYGHDAVADLLARRDASFGGSCDRGRAGDEKREDGAPARRNREEPDSTAGGLVAAPVPVSATRPAGSDGGLSPRDEGPLLSPE